MIRAFAEKAGELGHGPQLRTEYLNPYLLFYSAVKPGHGLSIIQVPLQAPFEVQPLLLVLSKIDGKQCTNVYPIRSKGPT